MKMRPLPAFGIAALAGCALLLDLYALAVNPAPPAGNTRTTSQPPIAADSARPGAGESENAPIDLHAGGSVEPVPREGRGTAAGGAHGGGPPVFAAGRPVPAESGPDGDSTPETRPARLATTPLAPVPSGAPAGADDASSAAMVPLAFRPLPPELAAANPRLADAVRGLQQDFVDAVGPSQNPNDPAYYQRWVTAQANIDERFRLMVGNEAFLVEQMAVNNR